MASILSTNKRTCTHLGSLCAQTPVDKVAVLLSLLQGTSIGLDASTLVEDGAYQLLAVSRPLQHTPRILASINGLREAGLELKLSMCHPSRVIDSLRV